MFKRVMLAVLVATIGLQAGARADVLSRQGTNVRMQVKFQRQGGKPYPSNELMVWLDSSDTTAGDKADDKRTNKIRYTARGPRPFLIAADPAKPLQIENTSPEDVRLIGLDLNVLLPSGESWEVKHSKILGKLQHQPIELRPTGANVIAGAKCHVVWFEHPYFAVSNEDGELELSGIPSGKRTLIFWSPEIGYIRELKQNDEIKSLTRTGKMEVELNGGTNDFGEVLITLK